MTEMFDIITAINALRSDFNQLNADVRFMLKYPSMVTFSEYIEEPKACKLLRRSLRSIQRLRAVGKLPFIRINNRVLYKASDLHFFMNSNFQNTPITPITLITLNTPNPP